MKTVDDLYEEIERAKEQRMVLSVHHYNHPGGIFGHPDTGFSKPKLNVVSLEFKPDTNPDTVILVYKHIQEVYGAVIFELRLISTTRIHIYVQAPPL